MYTVDSDECIKSGDTTCGSCCVDEIAAEHVNADGIIHFGHACLNPTIRLPVLHILPKQEFDVKNLINEFKRVFQDDTRKIIFFYDVEYAHKIEYVYNILRSMYKHLILSKLNCKSNVEYTDTKTTLDKVILGRNYTLEEEYNIQDYEGFFLGEEGKTLRILAMSIPMKRWYCFINNKINEFDALNAPWLKQRRFLVEKLKDAKTVGIVVATLGIKEYLTAITTVKEILKKKNKKTYTLCIGKITPAKLANFPEINAFVVVACPENEVFDSRDFFQPILTPYEVELAFNTAREFCPQYFMDFRQILPGGIHYVDFKPSTDSDISLISGDVRNCKDDALCVGQMNALTIRSSGTVAIGMAGAQYLQERSWRGVEQRLGEDPVLPAEIGRIGLACQYTNEPLNTDKCDAET
ncbi:2-(3-amino-3-carboxypropyl)histidine synthase subunit 2 isoform X2 [Odontomachus brunneus]|uniref:2-(3-amino-3-carboxypropyl)histidine synthase subunit 2 isoform X2 n=1 Tax=Odontomachus brunneus TaxID=486640 RepID=UPI0013F22F24|nr:2-(3-amino-3-carboxypropyl)histidine synthase subunit 2 isoform X2 [Odontomachus brunneus]XP_032689685.1 2-(3-amino-3-carboxypropyl)histidine synthase subunit 2 isoform X2 [Odontomachus brunneus]